MGPLYSAEHCGLITIVRTEAQANANKSAPRSKRNKQRGSAIDRLDWLGEVPSGQLRASTPTNPTGARGSSNFQRSLACKPDAARQGLAVFNDGAQRRDKQTTTPRDRTGVVCYHLPPFTADDTHWRPRFIVGRRHVCAPIKRAPRPLDA